MTDYSVTEAKNRLPELLDRMLAGEHVRITRHGNAIADLTPVTPVAKPVSKASLEWLAARRAGRGRPLSDAGTFVSQLRDEEWR